MITLQILQECGVAVTEKKKVFPQARAQQNGDAGDRTQDLMHAKHALYH